LSEKARSEAELRRQGRDQAGA